jgi:hypothetical protein
LLLLKSTLLSFGFLHLEHLLFCCNAGLLLVYNSALSQLCHYHKPLWKAESHFSFWHVGSKSHFISVCKHFTLFLTQKCFNTLPLWGVEEISLEYCLLECIVLLLCMPFLNSSSASAADVKKLLTVTTLQEPKQGSTMSIINFFP